MTVSPTATRYPPRRPRVGRLTIGAVEAAGRPARTIGTLRVARRPRWRSGGSLRLVRLPHHFLHVVKLLPVGQLHLRVHCGGGRRAADQPLKHLASRSTYIIIITEVVGDGVGWGITNGGTHWLDL